MAYSAEHAGAETIWNARFEDVIFNTNGFAEGVECKVEEDPVVISASIVVGADGPQSRVRSIIGSKTVIRKYPDSFLVGLVGPVPALEGRGRQYQGPGHMLGLMPVGRENCYMFYSVGGHSFDQVKAAGLGELKSEIVQVAPETGDAFGQVEAWTSMGYFTPSYVRVDPWVANGIVLFGDSAHTFHPHAGQGVNLSLQDALVLAEVIESALKMKDVSVKTLATYQEKRKMFADVIGQHAHYTSTYALSHNWLVSRLNRRALKKMQKDRKLLKYALTITAGLFTKKPGLEKQLRMGGILP
jgi:2-polyprenyl-6-methoxyphenol hydroxylase-like FAD-dependent oxidoreductase